MLTKIHIISDLDYGFNEFSDAEEFTIDDPDLIIVNGNIGHCKRSMLYTQQLCLKFPDTPVVYNLGWIEQYKLVMNKNNVEFIESFLIRMENNPTVPKNLKFSLDPQLITLKNGVKIDLLTTFGFCKIHKLNTEWKNTIWYKKYVCDSPYLETSPLNFVGLHDVQHGTFPTFATFEHMNNQYEMELLKVRNWELTKTCQKVLVTVINPANDPLYADMEVSPYLIHLNKGIWICAGPKVDTHNFLGARLISNPGRGSLARNHMLIVDIC